MYKILLSQFLCVLFSFQACFCGEIKSESINVVYHIATMKKWEPIVKEQIQAFVSSGLGDACDSMTVTVVGPEIEKVYPLFEGLTFKDKIEIIHAGVDFQLYEFPGIEKVQEIANNNSQAKILYIHSKGVSHGGTSTEKNVHQWRRFMEFFTVVKWKDCIIALDSVDACGVDWGMSAANIPCFAGNFWWAKGEYVKKCVLSYYSRFDCEIFIGTANPTVANFLSSGSNPRLRVFFSKKKIAKLQLFPKDSLYHQGVFNWGKYYYHEYYYHF